MKTIILPCLHILENCQFYNLQKSCTKKCLWNHSCSSWKLLSYKTKFSENLIYTPPIRSSPHYTLKHRQILYPCTNNCLQFIEWIFHANVIQANTSYILHLNNVNLIIKQLYRNISIIESFASDHRRNWSSIYRQFT